MDIINTILSNMENDDETIINDKFENLLWDILKNHYGHHVEIAIYGDINNPDNVCLEDMDTNEVILDAELYTIVAREDK